MDDLIHDDDNPDWSVEPLTPLDYAAKVKASRVRLGLNQLAFADLLGVPVTTLRNWEQRRTRPDALGLTMIDVVYDDPEGMAHRLRARHAA